MRAVVYACANLPVRSPCHSQSLRSAYAVLRIRCLSDNTSSKTQTFEGYIADKLDAPLYSVRPQTRTQLELPPLDELPKTAREETLAKARVVFGSRLAGPVERREQIEKLSTNVAGIMVPPKPDEPDNCCMSGCVNCVWDRYRDELEEWAEASAKARTKLGKQKPGGQQVGVSMDEDGVGSQGIWDAGGNLFADIPVGIREFMKTEKKLKERHRLRNEEKTQPG